MWATDNAARPRRHVGDRNEGEVMADLRKIKIDDKVIEVDPNLTLIQACEQAGEE